MGADIALWINNTILAGTGILVWRYVRASDKLVRSSQEQIENQWKPAIVLKEIWLNPEEPGLQLFNIGKGPALNVQCWLKKLEAAPDFGDEVPRDQAFSFLLTGSQPTLTEFSVNQLVGHALHCRYRSISGRKYTSVSAFTERGTTVETSFYPQLA